MELESIRSLEKLRTSRWASQKDKENSQGQLNTFFQIQESHPRYWKGENVRKSPPRLPNTSLTRAHSFIAAESLENHSLSEPPVGIFFQMKIRQTTNANIAQQHHRIVHLRLHRPRSMQRHSMITSINHLITHDHERKEILDLVPQPSSQERLQNGNLASYFRTCIKVQTSNLGLCASPHISLLK